MNNITSVLAISLSVIFFIMLAVLWLTWQIERAHQTKPFLVKSYPRNSIPHLTSQTVQFGSTGSAQHQKRQNFTNLATHSHNSIKYGVITDAELQLVDNMPGLRFEHYVGKLLRGRGYEVEVTKSSESFGVDIIAHRCGVKYAIQTKRHSQKVSRNAVIDAVAGKVHHQCHKAMVVTNRYYQHGAIELAKSTNCILVDRDELAKWIQTASRAGSYSTTTPANS